jgi:hypothetical protein
MTELKRLDSVTAGRVEVAIIFKEMLGVEDAAVYLAGNGVPQRVAERVLADPRTRRISDDAIVGYCQRDPEITWPTAPEKRAAPTRQERAVTLLSTPLLRRRPTHLAVDQVQDPDWRRPHESRPLLAIAKAGPT